MAIHINKLYLAKKLYIISFRILKQPGFGIQDLELYYNTANLANIVRILNTNSTPDWDAIEMEDLVKCSTAEFI